MGGGVSSCYPTLERGAGRSTRYFPVSSAKKASFPIILSGLNDDLKFHFIPKTKELLYYKLELVIRQYQMFVKSDNYACRR